MAEGPHEGDIIVVTVKSSEYYSFTDNNRKNEVEWGIYFMDMLHLIFRILISTRKAYIISELIY